jgi:hypothetical protein
VHLYSSNFCSQIVIVVPLSGNLVSYDNVALAPADKETVFALGQTIYLVANTISVQPIISVIIQTLTLNAGNVAAPLPVQLWSLTGITAAGTLAQIVLTPSSPTASQAQANFKVIGSQFGAKPNIRTPATMTALLLVTFLDTAGMIAKKHVTMTIPNFAPQTEANPNALSLQADIDIDSGNNDSLSSNLSPLLALLAVIPLIAGIILIRQCCKPSKTVATTAAASPAAALEVISVADSSV